MYNTFIHSSAIFSTVEQSRPFRSFTHRDLAPLRVKSITHLARHAISFWAIHGSGLRWVVFAHRSLDILPACPALFHCRLAAWNPTSTICVMKCSVLFHTRSYSFSSKILRSCAPCLADIPRMLRTKCTCKMSIVQYVYWVTISQLHDAFYWLNKSV